MFTSFIKPVTNIFINHPGVAFATAFAAVAAPAFIKDENRGYFRSALITTPVIAAMGIAGPGLITSASRNTKGGLRFIREMPFFFGKNMAVSYKDIRNFVETGGLDLGVLNPALRNWVDDSAVDFFSQVDRGAPPIEHSMESAMSIFNRLMPDTGKRTLLTYSVEGARQRAMSPVQLAGAASSNIMGAMAESDLRGIVATHRDDPKFVQEFSRRLRWAERLKDTGPVPYPPNIIGQSTIGLEFSEGLGLLQAQRPEVAEAIQAAIKKGTIDSATIVAEQSTTGQIERLLGINVKGKQGELALPIFEPTTGTVRLGEDYQRLGVGRGIITKQSVLDVDVFAAKHLNYDWKVLEKDINRAAYFGGIDPLNEFKMATHKESQLSTLSPQAMLINSKKAIASELPIYEGGKLFGLPGQPASESLTSLEKVNFSNRILGGELGRPMTRIGSEGGTSKGVFEYGETELYTVGGLPSLSKQAPFHRAFSKELQLNPEEILETWKPRFTTSAVEKLGGVPEVRMAVAGISPQQKSLFGDLPALIADLPAYEPTAIKRIIADTGVSTEVATEAWKKISEKLTAREGYYSAARKLGGLGEGGIILDDRFARLNMEAKTTIRVDKLHINQEEFKTKSFGPNQVIGYSGLEPVTSNAPQSFIEGVSSTGDRFEITLRQRFPVESGAKIDVAGVKGLAILAENKDFGRIRELMNLYGETTGSGTSIPNFANAIAPLHYTQAKVGDPFRTLLEQAGEVVAQVSTSRNKMGDALAKAGFEPTIYKKVEEYKTALENYGISLHTDTETAHLHFIEDSELVRTADRATRIENITNTTSQFMKDVGALVRDGAFGTEGGLFSAFRRSKMSDLLDYMYKNVMIASAGFWDSTRRNVPQLTSATFDLFSEMFRGGHLEGIKDIMSRLEFQGSPEMTSAFAQQFAEQDFTKPIGNVIDITDATGGVGIRLNSMESRAGSIFDPTREDIQQNFSLKLKEPVYVRLGGADLEVTHVPVLGKLAYGGGTNPFEKPGEGLAYGATEYEKKLAEVVRSAHDPNRMSATLSDYFQETYNVLFGKQGFYRARGIDATQAVSGFIQTRSTYSNTLQNADPFQMFISEQMARRVRDNKIREALLNGEEILATAVRHPIQTAPYMKVRVAPEAGLGPNMIGMDERIRAMFGADDDKDILNLFFYRHGTQAEREGLASVNNLASEQWKSANLLEMLYGSTEDSRNIIYSGKESLRKMVLEGIEKSGNTAGRSEQVTQRMAGSTIGAYSNLLTRIQQNIEMHPTIGINAEERSLLGHLFWSIRQVPIAAQKGKMKLNPEDPLFVARQIGAGLNARNQQGADQVMEAMKEVSKSFKTDKTILTTQSAKIYSEMTGKSAVAGDAVSSFGDVLNAEKTRNLISKFVIDRNPAADQMASLITRNMEGFSSDALYAVNAMYHQSGNAAPYLRGMVKETRSGRYVSKVLGAINNSIKEVSKEGGKALKPLAIGFGLAAAASLITRRIKDPAPARAAFSRGTGDFRPENVTNVTDQIPGEPITGSMASVNPARRQLPARQGTQTTIVAPMRQRTDLEVSMKAQDRSDTTEIKRMVSQIGGNQGVSNVTVNYRNGWRNKMSKLRQREEIRNQLEE